VLRDPLPSIIRPPHAAAADLPHADVALASTSMPKSRVATRVATEATVLHGYYEDAIGGEVAE
jgi:hypothetical protein